VKIVFGDLVDGETPSAREVDDGYVLAEGEVFYDRWPAEGEIAQRVKTLDSLGSAE